MTSPAEVADETVVLYGIPWESYLKIAEALSRYRLRHTYDRGALEMRRLLYGVSWPDYKAFIDALGDHSLRHTYAEGALEMMTPRKDHDAVKRLIGRLLETLAYELDINIQSIGSTTLSADSVERALQPDEAYYFANEPQVRCNYVYDSEVDPPPDLVLEVDVTSTCLPRLATFAALGVPEVWRYSGETLCFFLLSTDGETRSYQTADRSRSFPYLVPADFESILNLVGEYSEKDLIHRFIDRVKPRASGQQ